MTTALANQITLAERNMTGAPDLDAAIRLYALDPMPALRELLAHLLPSGGKTTSRHADHVDPTYQPA
ncbi:MAG: hypothetical protein QM779_07660 [Propionicimonas sp.]|uniref:hypothetical protein n=1 Tax=Propionicimonas sp. TaxID=1955623 RepID=UPI003D113488